MAESAAQEEVNPNIEVGIEASETDVADAGRGMTFDDIDSITDDKPAAKTKDAKSEKPKVVKEKTAKGKPSEDAGTTEGEESTEEPTKGDNGELPSGEANASVQSLKGSKLTATFNGEDFNMHTGATIPVKVDGQIQQVQVQELMNNYSGKNSWDKKFSDLSTDKNSFQDRVDTLDEYVNEIFTKANSINDSQDPVKSSFEVLRLIGNLTGQDSGTLMKNIRGAFRNEATQYQDMNELEKENWQLRQDAEYSSLDSELTTQSNQRAADKKAAREKQSETLETYGIDQERFRELGTYLAENLKSDKAPDLNMIIEYDRICMAHNALTAFDASRLQDDGLRNQLVDFAIKDPSITEDDLIAILNESFGESEEAIRERKAAENLKRKLGNASQTTKPKEKNIDERKYSNSAELWDDVD